MVRGEVRGAGCGGFNLGGWRRGYWQNLWPNKWAPRWGKGVGYSVRFENQSGPETEILFVTDGVLQRILLDDPELSGVGAVIFDEFHERRLSSDLSLARVLDLQESVRPDLRVVVIVCDS